MSATGSADSEVTSSLSQRRIKVLLIDDEPVIGKILERMLRDAEDIDFEHCLDPAQALQSAVDSAPTVILQDLVMPGVDGLALVRSFQQSTVTRDIPLIVLSAKEEGKVKAEAFALGASDYLVKLPDRVELVARIRHHSRGYINLLQRNEAYEAMLQSQKHLAAELAAASSYVQSLLPDPMTEGPIRTKWKFLPSTTLGGDAFGYHWLDEDHFALYLLDVCGHGVGAALLSISALNVLKAQALPRCDFLNPSEVLLGLNKAFPTSKHNKFFTMWYGVFNTKTRNLAYATAGHPPGLLLSPTADGGQELDQLRTHNLVIGHTFQIKGRVDQFESAARVVGDNSKLLLYSDGVYEFKLPDGRIMSLNEYVNAVVNLSRDPSVFDADRIVTHMEELRGSPGPFDDDFSLLEVIFE